MLWDCETQGHIHVDQLSVTEIDPHKDSPVCFRIMRHHYISKANIVDMCYKSTKSYMSTKSGIPV